jgi:hypothetical protein
VLHIYWFGLMIKLAIKVVRESQIDDIREKEE